MAHDLNLSTIADAQADNQWQTSNDADAQLANAVQDYYSVDFSAGHVTLTAAQFRSAFRFVPSAALAAARNLIIPTVKRAEFRVDNTDATYTISVVHGSTTVAVPAGKEGSFRTNGTANHLVGTILTPGLGGSGDVVGPGSAVNNNLAAFDGTTGKLLKDSGVAVDTDGTLAANSDAKIATQKAVKTYADALIAAANAVVYKGVIDCSGNPNYPAADAGHFYIISVAGKIGGASGTDVEAGDMAICKTDGTASGDQATVGAQWNIIQKNLVGAVLQTRQIIAGNGLTGTADLSADVTLNVGAGTGMLSNANDVAIDKASDANVRAATSNKVLTADIVFSAAAEVTLTDAATIAVDMSTFLNAIVTLGGNRTLGQPSNTKVGQSGVIRVVQDGTGSRTLAYHADWKFDGGTDPVLSTAAGATDLLFYQVIAANFIYAALRKAVA